MKWILIFLCLLSLTSQLRIVTMGFVTLYVLVPSANQRCHYVILMRHHS